MRSKRARVAMGAVTALALTGCAAYPEDGAPGTGKLSCSKPPLPGIEFKVVKLHPSMETLMINCNKYRGDLPDPILIQYLVYEEVEFGPTTGGEEGGEGAGMALRKRPVAGVGFEPFLGGPLFNMSPHNTAEEFQVDPAACADSSSDDCQISPAYYKGIVTPQAEWCSDATGVMSYQIWLTCNGSTSDFNPTVKAGSILVEEAYKISVTVEELDD